MIQFQYNLQTQPIRDEMAKKPFNQQFTDELDDMERRLHAIGRNFTQLCNETKVSRATPNRWKRQLPKTVAIVAEMQRVVERWEAEHAAASAIPGEGS
ncbi:hypothetical protein [Bordetella phage vB_BbrM_PHB04]|uniref:Uncharacterized protein n=1 Tax=Bordetella phage vB_BbrM_PHB04 TaxID=2029657 RepID=A0A291LA04_9CAUD|nr:hypothetical protein HOS14_gp104 [Bordetella phage vB_BbrM_PHB04]ATI15722.1 hypothetical protein [Bordetella phage vB_BbrM_PHB04]